MNNMEQKLNEIYGEVANTLNIIIPEKWDKVLLYGEINEDTRTAFFNYYPVGKKESIYSHDIPQIFNISKLEYRKQLRKLLDVLEELWHEFKNNEQEPWTNLTFILESNGKFNIEYDYTDLSNVNDVERHAIWDYKYLGIMPEDDYRKKFVEEFIKNTENR
jgi:uncharacterized protein (TIGR01741 family)